MGAIPPVVKTTGISPYINEKDKQSQLRFPEIQGNDNQILSVHAGGQCCTDDNSGNRAEITSDTFTDITDGNHWNRHCDTAG